MANDEHTLLLGEIKGKLDLVIANQDNSLEKIDNLDARLRKVEVKSAINGAVAGGIISIAYSLALEKIKLIIGAG